jgi:hypothetical protein
LQTFYTISQHFLTSFGGTSSTVAEKKVSKEAYAHFENEWGSFKRFITW